MLVQSIPANDSGIPAHQIDRLKDVQGRDEPVPYRGNKFLS
jgi:hypothetical protein